MIFLVNVPWRRRVLLLLSHRYRCIMYFRRGVWCHALLGQKIIPDSQSREIINSHRLDGFTGFMDLREDGIPLPEKEQTPQRQGRETRLPHIPSIDVTQRTTQCFVRMSDFTQKNIALFNKRAAHYETPDKIAFAKHCVDAFLKADGVKWDPNSTVVVDFACGTGTPPSKPSLSP